MAEYSIQIQLHIQLHACSALAAVANNAQIRDYGEPELPKQVFGVSRNSNMMTYEY